jgi:hypothetical protein
VGAINGAGLVTAATIDLDAATGIGNLAALELSGAAITADTTNGNIDLDNAVAATFGSVTTGTGTITVDNTGAAEFTTVTTTDGGIDLEAIGGNLTVGTNVAAGGTSNVALTTSTSGDVILTGTTTASGDTVTISSVGAINGAGLVTAATIDLDAATGIGNLAALEVDASTLLNASTGGAVGEDIIINDVSGNLPLGTINSGMGDSTLMAVSGSITDGNADATNIVAHDVSLNAVLNIGDIGDFFEATGDAIEIQLLGGGMLTNAVITQANGEIFLDFEGDLVVASNAVVVDADGDASAILSASGDIDVASSLNA